MNQNEVKNAVENEEVVSEEETTTEEATLEETVEEANEMEQESSGGEAAAPDENEEVTALKAEVEELQNKWLRTQADYDNFRRRARLEKEEAAKYASQNVIEQLLPVIDNFERAIAASKENEEVEALTKGVEMIYRQLLQVLEQEGLKAIEAVNQPFDPKYHQAVMQVESADHEEGTVVEELQTGYQLKDKVIRPTMVKVSS